MATLREAIPQFTCLTPTSVQGRAGQDYPEYPKLCLLYQAGSGDRRPSPSGLLSLLRPFVPRVPRPSLVPHVLPFCLPHSSLLFLPHTSLLFIPHASPSVPPPPPVSGDAATWPVSGCGVPPPARSRSRTGPERELMAAQGRARASSRAEPSTGRPLSGGPTSPTAFVRTSAPAPARRGAVWTGRGKG